MLPAQPLSLVAPLPDDQDFAEIARKTAEGTSLDLPALAWMGEERTDNIKLQVYGVAMSLYRNRRLHKEGIRPDIIAEHSMGIYAALAACDSITEEDALELVYRIGLCCSRMGEVESYALGCVIGLKLEPLSAIAANHGVHLANLNTSRHFLLSGTLTGIESSISEALEAGAFSASVFPSDAPLHSPLMEDLDAQLREICGDFRYREPSVPLLNHIDQTQLSSAQITQFMTRELYLPVHWERSYLALKASGVGKFFEVGCGDSLKKYNRWIDSENESG